MLLKHSDLFAYFCYTVHAIVFLIWCYGISQETINNLFYKCVESLKQDNSIRIVNAIQVNWLHGHFHNDYVSHFPKAFAIVDFFPIVVQFHQI